jgi:hypothetical protein
MDLGGVELSPSMAHTVVMLAKSSFASNKSFILAKPLSSEDDLTRVALALVSNTSCQSSAKSPDQVKSDA